MARAAEVLRTARRPFVIAGGGVRHSEAEDELRDFVETLGIPVAETSAGKGSLTRVRWLVGGMGVNGTRAANEIAADRRRRGLRRHPPDRLHDRLALGLPAPRRPLHRHQRQRRRRGQAVGASPIVADAREALRSLGAALGGPLPDREARRSQVTASWSTWRADLVRRHRAGSPRPSDGPGRGAGCAQRRGPRRRQGRRRRRLAARRPAQAVGHAGRLVHPHRVRLLVHGPRDPRGHRRPDARRPRPARSSW